MPRRRDEQTQPHVAFQLLAGLAGLVSRITGASRHPDYDNTCCRLRKGLTILQVGYRIWLWLYNLLGIQTDASESTTQARNRAHVGLQGLWVYRIE